MKSWVKKWPMTTNLCQVLLCYTNNLIFHEYLFTFQVARMIIVVAMAFLVAWTPFYIVIFVSQVQENSFLKEANFVFTMLATHLIGFLNSCINPFIYNFMSEKFRKSFANIIASVCFVCCAKGFIQPSMSFKSQADSAAEYDGPMSPGCQPSCSDDQSSNLVVKMREKQNSTDIVLVKMSPLNNCKSHKANKSQCIFKYSAATMHKMIPVNERKHSPSTKINLSSLQNKTSTDNNCKTTKLRDDIPVALSHKHTRLVEDNMAPESDGALSAPKPNIVVQRAMKNRTARDIKQSKKSLNKWLCTQDLV